MARSEEAFVDRITYALGGMCNRTANYVRRLLVHARGVPPVIRHVRSQQLTFLDVAALDSLARGIHMIERDSVPGVILEAGCAKGGSAIVMAEAKSPNRPMVVYDTFSLIPPPSERDDEDVHRRYATIRAGLAKGPGESVYYGYEPDLLGRVKQAFDEANVPWEKRNVSFVVGTFQETLVETGPIAFAHVDGDWYDSVDVCLRRILPRLAPGGIVVVDDYFAWSGCRYAVRDVLHDLPDDVTISLLGHPRVWLVRELAGTASR